MDINTSFNPHWQAFQSADHGAQRHGNTVARHGARIEGSEEHDTATVEAREPEDQAHAGASVVKSPEETLGTRIDTRA